MIAAEVIADSISPRGIRLTTMVVDCHRLILAEFNTHRVFSRNSASSRAIPIAKRIEQVRKNPAIPTEWGKNQPGMQASEELVGTARDSAVEQWKQAATSAANRAEIMAMTELHKQVAARILEPFLWHRIVVSSTEWNGFFVQRCSPLAQPEIRVLAEHMQDALDRSIPVLKHPGDWHLPFIAPEELDNHGMATMRMASVARCARVSFLNEGKKDIPEDLKLYRRLRDARPVHASPFEHVATPATEDCPGNFTGWEQLRHLAGLDAYLTPG